MAKCLSTGKPVLPDPKIITQRFFKRTKFRPDPQGTSLMFAFMAQHFTHEFFKTDQNQKIKAFTKALGHGVRYTLSTLAICSNLTRKRQNLLCVVRLCFSHKQFMLYDCDLQPLWLKAC